MLKLWLQGALLSLMLVAVPSWSAFEVPKLPGRILDQAGLINAATEQRINKLLAGHEQASSNQVIVVTLKDLQGYSIEQAGVDMGRAWGVGQKDQDNGILLILAQAERKVRIEVGYGLEGTITDAVSATIVQQIMLPMFKQGDINGGLLAGTQAIVTALGGQFVAPQAKSKRSGSGLPSLIFLFIFMAAGAMNRLGAPSAGKGGRRGRSGLWLLPLMLLGGGGGRGHGGGGFGGFSGGGGGFGGGGASGGW
jgi:uncharacterized protein